jgi:hypothetical protein
VNVSPSSEMLAAPCVCMCVYVYVCLYMIVFVCACAHACMFDCMCSCVHVCKCESESESESDSESDSVVLSACVRMSVDAYTRSLHMRRICACIYTLDHACMKKDVYSESFGHSSSVAYVHACK